MEAKVLHLCHLYILSPSLEGAQKGPWKAVIERQESIRKSLREEPVSLHEPDERCQRAEGRAVATRTFHYTQFPSFGSFQTWSAHELRNRGTMNVGDSAKALRWIKENFLSPYLDMPDLTDFPVERVLMLLG